MYEDDNAWACKLSYASCLKSLTVIQYIYMNKEKNLSPSQGLNLGLPITSQMLLPLRHQDS